MNPLAAASPFAASKGSAETGEAFYQPSEAMVRSPQQFKDVFKEGSSKLSRSVAGGASSIGELSRSVSKALSMLGNSEGEKAPHSSPAVTVHGVDEGISGKSRFVHEVSTLLCLILAIDAPQREFMSSGRSSKMLAAGC